MKKNVLGLWLAVLLFCALPFASEAQAPDQVQAVEQLRQLLEARTQAVTLEFFSEEQLETPAADIFWAAVEHTGVPTQGDYIRWHMDKMDYEEDVREQEGGWYYTLHYTFGYRDSAQEEQQLDLAIRELLAELDVAGCSDYRKAYAIYDYICQNVAYDETAQYFSAYDALIGKTAVCQGYATLIYRLALEMGLDCRVISGTSRGQHHGWNIVKIRDRYYNLDATWDAGATRYTNFLKGQNSFYFHTRDAAFKTTEFKEAFPVSDTNYLIRSDCTEVHSFTAYRYNGDATCTEDGTQTATCDNCEVTQTLPMEGSALGHEFGQYESNGDATMWQDGTQTGRCIRCEVTDTQPDPGSRLPKNGWLQEEDRWYYYREDVPATGWLRYGKDWYYLKPSGEMVTGWLRCGSNWYYLGPTGVMNTGWLQYGGSWYYLHTSGAMATGWQQVQGKWYFLNASGAMRTGWFFDGKNWYFLRGTGEMVTGWLRQGSTWYYLDRTGAMATGTRELGGKTYRFDANGACLNP